MIDFASALWNQRFEIQRARARLTQLHRIVGRPVDLNLGQWIQLYAFCMEYSPDVVVELGRGWGNSTCVFTEAANRLRTTRVVSIGYDSERTWSVQTAPRLGAVVPASWFDVLEVMHNDILQTDFSPILARDSRTLLFWDAHGHNLARYLLAQVMPILATRDHVVVVHDIADSRYADPGPTYGSDDGLSQTWLGPLVGPFDELIPLYDFLSRNRIAFDSPNHSMAQRLLNDPQRCAELQRLWGDDFPTPSPLEVSSWIYFDLHHRERRDALVFPPRNQEHDTMPGELAALRRQVDELNARLARLEPILGPLRAARNGLRRLVGRGRLAGH